MTELNTEQGHSCDGSECGFAEVEIGEDDGPLRAGMKVLIPCECGDTPLDSLEFQAGLIKEYQATLERVEPRRALFHWSPVERRKSILRRGLVPGSRCTTSSGRFKVVCFADSPSWAWALSAEICGEPGSEWDLWQCALDLLVEPTILPGEDRASGIYEVRTEHRVFKRDLWFVGTRTR